ncbi:hypothetical protein EVAR_7863_1 [Eumeta japonica]|uniref:Uncharacterized protein n=1 Tax=Eumeta variegata TaxID=151549 RepID=A0A4C1TV44_EUMVA|nr:hypothetical protein EVAR_7863_1 [Eumeta japonica]
MSNLAQERRVWPERCREISRREVVLYRGPVIIWSPRYNPDTELCAPGDGRPPRPAVYYIFIEVLGHSYGECWRRYDYYRYRCQSKLSYTRMRPRMQTHMIP